MCTSTKENRCKSRIRENADTYRRNCKTAQQTRSARPCFLPFPSSRGFQLYEAMLLVLSPIIKGRLKFLVTDTIHPALTTSDTTLKQSRISLLWYYPSIRISGKAGRWFHRNVHSSSLLYCLQQIFTLPKSELAHDPNVCRRLTPKKRIKECLQEQKQLPFLLLFPLYRVKNWRWFILDMCHRRAL